MTKTRSRKSYARLTSEFFRTPWAILPEKLCEIGQGLAMARAGEEIVTEEWAPLRAAFEARVAAARRASGAGIMVIPVFGIIAHRMNVMMHYSGGTSTEMLAKEFRAALNDPDVGTIVLDFESPGGDVFGLQEAADEIRAGRERKPIVAVADAYAFSAAYWLASAASEISISPSGQVGSIGVWAMHADIFQMLEMEGIKPTLISAGRFKVEGNSFSPLSDEARAQIQKEVDAYYRDFLKAVALGRGVTEETVKQDFGEGRMVMADEALKLGMVDRIETLEQVLTRLKAGGTKPGRGRAKGGLRIADDEDQGDAPGERETIIVQASNREEAPAAPDPAPALETVAETPSACGFASDLTRREWDLRLRELES